MDLSELRISYTKAGLVETDADPDPVSQFRVWMDQAISVGLLEPNAMTLATTDASGQPDTRIVLLKAFDESGFVFYTNYESRKAHEIEQNPHVSLLFYWGELERQVRISGVAARVSEAESDEYFQSRPVGHQLGAWVSNQSTVIACRQVLEDRLANLSKQFELGPIPRPPHWGGFRVAAHVMEFWQGRPNRLHDRLEYRRSGNVWLIRRLSP
jgi:pyridoxamine 5'-phosphate oxidase